MSDLEREVFERFTDPRWREAIEYTDGRLCDFRCDRHRHLAPASGDTSTKEPA